MITHSSQKVLYRQTTFTLVELLLVLVILGTLAAIVLPKLTGRSESAKISSTEMEISTIGSALDRFEIDMGHFPESNEGIEALHHNLEDSDSWKGPYLNKEVYVDPWNTEYFYQYPGEFNPNGFDLSSAGPDGEFDTEDDISNWTTVE